MATMAVVQAQVDETVKAQVEDVLQREGLTLSQAFRVFLECTAQQRAIPTEIFHPHAETLAAIEAARHGEVRRITSLQELIVEVDGEDESA